MSAPKGNQFWKMRSRHGPHAMFTDPVKLQEACIEYFEWVEANPLKEEKIGFYMGESVKDEIVKMRPMTMGGLSIFLGITMQCLYEWKKSREDLKPVIEWAESVIRDQKFAGAAAGLLNANIISRDLGLADKQIHDVTVPQMIIKPPEGERPYEEPPIHGEE